jgi:hypothetical protein
LRLKITVAIIPEERIMLKEITKDQALFCIVQKEFGDEIIRSADKIAIFLTQSWYPEWHAMKRFIGDLPD